MILGVRSGSRWSLRGVFRRLSRYCVEIGDEGLGRGVGLRVRVRIESEEFRVYDDQGPQGPRPPGGSKKVDPLRGFLSSTL